MKLRRFAVLGVFISLLLLGSSTIAFAQSANGSKDNSQPWLVSLNFKGLEDLGEGWAYEGWVIIDGEPVSTGTFTVDENGVASQTTFGFEGSYHHRDLGPFVLTIEPSPDPDPAPSATHLLAGDFRGKRAKLRVNHPAALGNNFKRASGDFILAVPSDSSGATPYTHGIWWLNLDSTPSAGLSLPTLPAGWVYEGWVVGPDGPISTGTFTDVAAADSDGGGATAGPDGTPPFPGQDFVNPPTDLTGYAAVISIEPSPDNSPAPFTLKPLVDSNIEDLGAAGLSQSMENNAKGFVKGTAVLHQARRYEITIENLSDGQPLSPPIAITHRKQLSLFAKGELASPEIEAIAEDGNNGFAAELWPTFRKTTQVVPLSQPLTRYGTTVGDFSDTITFEIWARPGDRLTIASMLICSNDGITGLSGVRLPKWGERTYYSHAYDAGTEANSELSSDLVDPCSALGPHPLNGDPNGNENTAVAPTPIYLHDGIQGNGDLTDAHDWNNKISRITIERIED